MNGTIKTVFDILGYASTLIVIVGAIVGVVTWLRGILPAIIRLGKGLAQRKIALFAKGDNLSSIRNLLLDSTLFNEQNIVEITSSADIGRAERATLFLVHWHDWEDNFDQLLSKKRDGTALIIYAPRDLGPIREKQMTTIGEQRNTTVTNFRGRLLNDIVTSMITTSYE